MACARRLRHGRGVGDDPAGREYDGQRTRALRRADADGDAKGRRLRHDDVDLRGHASPNGTDPHGRRLRSLRAGGFQRATVRALRLEPHPGVFTRDAVLTGWGRPTGVGKEGGVDSFFYEDGLLVIFDKGAWSAVTMLFTLPQPSDQAKPSR